MAATAASVMLSGVAKSGSPISRWTTCLPSASSRRARASTSNALSVPRRSMRSANRMPMSSMNPTQGAAVDADGLAREVAGLHRAEEGAGRAQLRRVAQPAGRDAARHLLQVRVELPDAVGEDGAGRQV